MKRWFRPVPFLLFLTFLPAFAQNPAPDPTPPPILIVEIQTGTEASASEEFVELFNQTDEPFAADELRLQYRSASGSDWLTKAQLEGRLEPRGRYLIATNHLAETADIVNGLGLAAAGGHLRLVLLAGNGEEAFDEVAWGTAQYAAINPATAPAAGQSLKRSVDEDGAFIDSADDALDFLISISPTPQSSPAVDENSPEPEPDSPAPGAGSSPPPTANSPGQAKSSAKLEISELFIDPDQPLTDANDEFVELFNPNPDTVDLEGYVIQTGTRFSYSFTLPNVTIKPKQYLAFFSLDTGLALSNSGGAARLLSPNKAPLYEVPPYEAAKPGLSWANISGNWRWTAKPTPNAANTAAGTGNTAAGLAGNGGGAALSRGRTLGAADERNVYEEPPAAANNQVDTAVVAGVGAMALLYAGNEYRYDITNFFSKFKRYLAARRGGGAAA